jgi:hypothetical protein
MNAIPLRSVTDPQWPSPDSDGYSVGDSRAARLGASASRGRRDSCVSRAPAELRLLVGWHGAWLAVRVTRRRRGR